MVDFNYVMRCSIEISDALLEASRKMREAQVSISLIEDERLLNGDISETTHVLLDRLKRGILTRQGDIIELEMLATSLRANLVLKENGIDIRPQDDEEDYEAPKESK